MRLDDLLGDGQSQSGAGTLGARFLHAVEAVKDVRKIFLRDPWSAVGHGDAHLLGIGGRRQPYLTAHRSVFESIVQQVGKHLSQTVRVSPYSKRLPDVREELDPLLLSP